MSDPPSEAPPRLYSSLELSACSKQGVPLQGVPVDTSGCRSMSQSQASSAVLLCAWQAQYIELSGGAAARWPPLARGCLLPGRRSTQSLRTSLLRGRRSIHRASWRSCGAVAAAGPRLPFAWQPAVQRHRALRGRGNTQSSTEWSSSQLLTAPLLTGPLLITTHHNLSHPNSSQFHFSHLTSHTFSKFTFKSHIHKGLTCGVIRSFYFFLGRPGGLPETN